MREIQASFPPLFSCAPVGCNSADLFLVFFCPVYHQPLPPTPFCEFLADKTMLFQLRHGIVSGFLESLRICFLSQECPPFQRRLNKHSHSHQFLAQSSHIVSVSCSFNSPTPLDCSSRSVNTVLQSQLRPRSTSDKKAMGCRRPWALHSAFQNLYHPAAKDDMLNF